MLRIRYSSFLDLHGLLGRKWDAAATAIDAFRDEDYAPPNEPPLFPSQSDEAVTAVVAANPGPTTTAAVSPSPQQGLDGGPTGRWSDGDAESRSAGLASLIRARSTDFRRTHMSGFYVLVGLLASEGLARRVPVSIWEDKDENLYNNENCQRLNVLFRDRMRSVVQRAYSLEEGWRKKVEGKARVLADAVGVPLEKMPWVAALDVVECRHLHGQALPMGLMWRDIVEFRRHLSKDYADVFACREVAQLAMGRLVNEMMTSMENVLAKGEKKAQEPRLVLYSGHDATIMPLSASLGVPFPTWPPYSSSIIVELWASEDDVKRYVRVLYNGEPVVLPPPQPLVKDDTWRADASWSASGNSVFCPWERFVKITEWTRLTEDEFQARCAWHPDESADSKKGVAGTPVEAKHV